jgi:dimethylglycine dehydrogenase
LVTEPVPELAGATTRLPVLRDLNIPMYARQERGGLLVSCYETHAIHFGLDGVPKDFGQELLPPDLERAAPSLERIAQMIPAFSRAGIKQVINGPTSRAADLKPCVGPAHGLPNYFTLCGVVGGFLQSGLSKYLAEWIVDGEPSVDLSSVDVRRFGPYATKSYAAACTATGHAYSNPVHYPHGIATRGRPARVSALYGTLKAKGAVFGPEGGWEAPLWFRRNGAASDDGATFERQLWAGEAATEAHAMTEDAALLDLSSRAKFEVSGTGAAAWLAALTKDRVPVADGAVADAAVLTAKGRVEALVSIERKGADRFYVTASGATEGHVRHALVCKAPADVAVADRTAADGMLWLGGAKAAEVLAKAARGKAPDARSARGLDIGIARARVRRVDDVATPAYEIVAPMEQLVAIYEALQAAGAATDAGHRAYDALRIRAGRPAWGVDVAHDTFAAEAGLGTAGTATTRLVRLKVEGGKVDPWGGEIVLAKDADVGVVTSAAPWGAGSVAIARVGAAHAKPGQRLALEILGTRRDAVIDAVL